MFNALERGLGDALRWDERKPAKRCDTSSNVGGHALGLPL